MLPSATRIAVLVNPDSPADTEPTVREVSAAASALAIEIRFFNTSSLADVDATLADILNWRPSALFVAPAPPFSGQFTRHVASWATRHALPSSGFLREWVVDADGLMSYGPDLADSYRQAGVYVGRILKGERPANLPVVQPTKHELLINLKTAKTLGLTIPEAILVQADQVIE